MNLIKLLWPILLLCTANLKVEELPSFTIVELSAMSGQILEAKFLEVQDNNYIFLTRDIESSGDFTDTLALSYLGGMYEEPMEGGAGFRNSERVIIYISDMEEMVGHTISGFRLLKEGRIYSPWQRDNPGNYSFAASIDTISWSAFKERIIKVHQRISAVKALEKIEDPVRRNRELFHWIEASKHSFYQPCSFFDEDCGWGLLDARVFNWIPAANIAQDTWEVSQLYREINANSGIDWRNGMGYIHDENGSSFNTYDDIDFLINIATNEDQVLEERRQALVFLSPAVRKVYENNYPIPDSIRLAFQTEKQTSIRNTIFPLMEHPILKSHAFGLVSKLSNPMDGNLRHRIDLSLLPEITEYFKKEKPKPKDYSNYRAGLANFVAYNSSEEAWRAVTGCDANIYMELKEVKVDTVRNTLSFDIYYGNGRKAIYDMPTVVIRSLKDGKKYLFSEGYEVSLPWFGGSKFVRMDLKILGLEPGYYECYVKGMAAEVGLSYTTGKREEADMIWRTGVVGFEL